LPGNALGGRHRGLQRSSLGHLPCSTASLDNHVHMQMLWGRSIIEGKQTPQHGRLSMTYVGHTIVKQPCTKARHAFIDTGSFLLGTGRLTMIEPATGHIWQAQR